MTDKIILGTAQFGLNYGINNSSGKPGMDEAHLIFDLAFKNNIRLLDTAEAYGNSQEVIGEYHKESPNKFEVITKFSPSRTDLGENIAERIEKDLHVLSVSKLHGYMFHSFAGFEKYYPGFKNEIDSLKQQGLIKKLGVSVHSNKEIESLLSYEGVDFIQFPFNVFDNSEKRSLLISKVKSKGIEVHTRSVFLQGLIFKKQEHLPEKLQPMIPYLKRLRNISVTHKINLNDLALNYAVQQKDIDHVLIGVDTAEHLKKNITSLQNKIPASVMQEINSIIVEETELLNPANWNK